MANYGLPAPRKENRNGTLRVAYLGRYDRNKGVYRLLDVWRRLNLERAGLDFYGFGTEDKPLRARVAENFSDGSVRVNPSFFGKDLGEMFANIDLLVLPSISEGLPLVLLEAMAHGVPFVATDVGAIGTLAEGNPDVLVVPNNDEAIKEGLESMARAIRSGTIDGQRLQRYHKQRYDYEKVSAVWVDALLNPHAFWRSCGSEIDPLQFVESAATAS
jgi:glycosyltransferase involved in cell wall biosynthesis